MERNKKASTSAKANKSRTRRENLKTDPNKAEQLKFEQSQSALRSQLWRLNLTDEKKQDQREKARVRQQRYAEKHRDAIQKRRKDNRVNKTLTRKEKQQMCAKWSEQQRKYRSEMSRQKKIQVNERRRKLYKLKTAAAKKVASSSDSDASSSDSDMPYKSKAAYHHAVRKARASLPESPSKFAVCIKGLIKTTPRKRKALNEGGIVDSPKTKVMKNNSFSLVKKLTEELDETKSDKTEPALKRRRLLCGILSKGENMTSKEVGVSWSFFTRCSMLEEEGDGFERKKRCDSLSVELVEKVEDFYNRHDNATMLATKKTVSKKTKLQQKVLDSSLKDLHAQFQEEFPEEALSYSTFTKLRPSNIRTMSSNLFRQCLCEYCTNIELKLKGLPIENKYMASRLTLCVKEGDWYAQNCITRQCDECGVEKFREYIVKNISDDAMLQTVEWNCWETVTFDHNGKKCTRKMLTNKSGTLDELITKACQELESFSEHLHIAKWQYKQFDFISKNVPENAYVLVIDFAENYTCTHQDQVSGAHWSMEQVTLFPAVAYYTCPTCEDSVIRESIIVLSPDKKHDAAAVFTFLEKIHSYLQQNESRVFTKQILFSDGAPSHFKCKTAFFETSKLEMETDWNFFGARHGKSPCDGEGGVVKSAVTQAVKNGKAIVQNANDMFTFCEANLTKAGDQNSCCHSRRKFIIETDVLRRKGPLNEICGVPNVRKKVFCLQNMNKHGSVRVRNLACYCQNCVAGSECLLVDNWTEKCLLKKKNVAESDNSESEASNHDLEFENHEINVDVLTTSKPVETEVNVTGSEASNNDQEFVRQTRVTRNETEKNKQGESQTASGTKQKTRLKQKQGEKNNQGKGPSASCRGENQEMEETSLRRLTRLRVKRDEKNKNIEVLPASGNQNQYVSETGLMGKKDEKSKQVEVSQNRGVRKSRVKKQDVSNIQNDEIDNTKPAPNRGKPTKTKAQNTSTGAQQIISKLRNELHTAKRKTFFNSVQYELGGEEYDTLKDVLTILLPLVEAKYPIAPKTDVDTSKLKICKASLTLLPADIVNLFPYENYGDGNCLYKSASMIVTGHSKDHNEFRVRTIMELCAFDSLYLSDSFLCSTKNVKIPNLALVYGSCSKFDMQRGESNADLFKREVRNNLFSFQESGCWQVHALSEVLHCKLFVIYPDVAGHKMKKCLHGCILPRSCMGNPAAKAQNIGANIMWTATYGKESPHGPSWIPNHFVACFKRLSVAGSVVEDQHSVAEDHQSVAEDHHSVAEDNPSVADSVAEDDHSMAEDHHSVADSVAEDHHGVADSVAEDHQSVAEDHHSVADSVSEDHHSVADSVLEDQHSVADSVAEDQHSVAGSVDNGLSITAVYKLQPRGCSYGAAFEDWIRMAKEIPDVDVHESESDDGRHEETPQQSTPKKGVVYIDYDDFVTTKMKEDLNWLAGVQDTPTEDDLVKASVSGVQEIPTEGDLVKASVSGVQETPTEGDLVKASVSSVQETPTEGDLVKASVSGVQETPTEGDLVKASVSGVQEIPTEGDLVKASVSGVQETPTEGDLVKASVSGVQETPTEDDLVKASVSGVQETPTEGDLVKASVSGVQETPTEGDLVKASVSGVQETPTEGDLVTASVSGVHETPTEGDLVKASVSGVHETPTEGDLVKASVSGVQETPTEGDVVKAKEVSPSSVHETESGATMLAISGVQETPTEDDLVKASVSGVQETPTEGDLVTASVSGVHETPTEGDLVKASVSGVHETPTEGDLVKASVSGVQETPTEGDVVKAKEVSPSSVHETESGATMLAISGVQETPTEDDLVKASVSGVQETPTEGDLVKASVSGVQETKEVSPSSVHETEGGATMLAISGVQETPTEGDLVKASVSGETPTEDDLVKASVSGVQETPTEDDLVKASVSGVQETPTEGDLVKASVSGVQENPTEGDVVKVIREKVSDYKSSCSDDESDDQSNLDYRSGCSDDESDDKSNLDYKSGCSDDESDDQSNLDYKSGCSDDESDDQSNLIWSPLIAAEGNGSSPVSPKHDYGGISNSKSTSIEDQNVTETGAYKKGDYKKGDYILISVQRRHKRGNPIEYPAEVLDVENGLFYVSYVKTTHLKDVFKWPDPPDKSWISQYCKDIIKKLKPPITLNVRMGYIQFEDM